MSSNLLAISSLLAGATLWGIVWYPLRLLDSAGLTGLWCILLVFGTAAVVGSLRLPRHWSEIRQYLHLFALIAITAGWCNVAFILAILDGNVIRVMLLFYLSPVWTTLLGCWLLAERLSVREWWTLVIAMAGAMFMLWDPTLGLPWPRDNADWLALSAGLAFSVSNITTRKLQQVSVTPKVLSNWWGVTVLSCLWLLISDAVIPEVAPAVLAWSAILGLLVVTMMSVFVLYGVSHLPAYRSAVILLFELVVGALSSQWLTDEIVLLAEWMGGGLIVLAAYISARNAVGDQQAC